MGFNESNRGNYINALAIEITYHWCSKDFHFQSLHYKIEPLIMTLDPDIEFFIRMKPDKITSTVDYIKKTIQSFNPSYLLNFHFLGDDYDNLYRTEQRMSKIIRYSSFLAIFISCLGLIRIIFIYDRAQDKRNRNKEN